MVEIEEQNPKYTAMVKAFSVARNEIDRCPYYGLKAFEKNRGPIHHLISKKDAIELHNDYSLIGRTCFNEAIAYVNKLKIDLLDKQPIFQIPLSKKSLTFLMTLREFKGLNREQLVALTTKYPVEGLVFVQT